MKRKPVLTASKAVMPATKRVKNGPDNHPENRPNDLYAIELPPRVRLLMAVRAVYDHAFALLGIEPVNNM